MNYTIIDALNESANISPFSNAILDERGNLNYSDLRDEAGRMASWLRCEGLQRGARAGVCLAKSREEVVAILGIAGARGVCVNLNYQWTLNQIDFVRTDCDIGILITDARKANQIIEAGFADRFKKILVVGEAVAKNLALWREVAFMTPVLERPLSYDLAAILYTSGSTGRPKGVMIPHEMLRRGAEIVTDYLGIRPSDRILSVLPFSFGYGLNQLTSTLLKGATLALQPVVMPSAIVDAVDNWEITALPLVAPSWVQLIRFLIDDNHTLPGLRYVTSAGGATPMQTLAEMPGRLPNAEIILMYGLTEGFRSTYLPPHLFQSKMGAIGIAVPNVEIFVVDPQKGICGPNEVGELIHRGDLISRGYWRRPDDTARCICVNEHLRPLIGDEKVLHTGDLVRRDEDGVLWYVGRNDGMIKTSGHRVSPSEIELVAGNVPGVISAVAFGVPDADLGQVIHLVLELKAGSTEPEILRILKQQLPSYMVPRRLIFWECAMPVTANGKIDRLLVIEGSKP